MLKIIINEWSFTSFGERSTRIALFILDIYLETHAGKRPIEEREIIDNLIKEKLNLLPSEYIRGWIMWLKDRSQNDAFFINRKPKNVPENLIRNFILAQARNNNSDRVALDIRNQDIIERLGLDDLIGDDAITVLRDLCKPQLELYWAACSCARDIDKIFLINEDEKVSCHFQEANRIEIRVKKRRFAADKYQYYQNFYDRIIEEMKKHFLLDKTGLPLFEGRVFALKLVICDELGNTQIEKETWEKEE